MDLNAQIAADIPDVFLAEGGIGVVDAVYRAADGTVIRALKGIHDREYAEVPGEFAPVAGRREVFHTAEAYWPSTFQPVVGATLEIQVDPLTVTTYTVRAAEPDGVGMVDLILEAP